MAKQYDKEFKEQVIQYVLDQSRTLPTPDRATVRSP